jgi:hypothetical protein
VVELWRGAFIWRLRGHLVTALITKLNN